MIFNSVALGNATQHDKSLSAFVWRYNGMCHGWLWIGTIFRLASDWYRPSSGILWTVKWYWIQLHLIVLHSLETLFFYCFLVHEESLTIDTQSSPYWSDSKQLGPGHMLLPQWKLLFPFISYLVYQTLYHGIYFDTDSVSMLASLSLAYDLDNRNHQQYSQPRVVKSETINFSLDQHSDKGKWWKFAK